MWGLRNKTEKVRQKNANKLELFTKHQNNIRKVWNSAQKKFNKKFLYEWTFVLESLCRPMVQTCLISKEIQRKLIQVSMDTSLC